MRFDPVNDFVAPLTVTAIDLVVESVAPQWDEWAAYITAAGGYLAAWQNFNPDFTKNMGIAALPWASKKLYQRVMAMVSPTVSGRRLALRPSSRVASQRWPAPSMETQFRGARLV